ncbi:hypothetical protein Ares1_0104 [Vibrio phage Ares1]|nr:hypothetical protein Ares1_0104 [Vibrio phage Ares1]
MTHGDVTVNSGHMHHPKAHYKALEQINGYKWAYYDRGLHTFIKGNHREGYLHVNLSEADIADPRVYRQMLSRDLSRSG